MSKRRTWSTFSSSSSNLKLSKDEVDKEDNNLDLKEVCLYFPFSFYYITSFIHGKFTS